MNQSKLWRIAVGMMLAVAMPSSLLLAGSPVVKSEFIFQSAPTPFSYAPTIAESGGTLVVAWYAGSADAKPDSKILLSRLVNNVWTAPIEVANGKGAGNARSPVWNPVLFQPATGPLLLFYKVGAAPTSWVGFVKQSTDGGKTFGAAKQLPNGVLGPIKNKPFQLNGSTLLCGSGVQRANVAPTDPNPPALLRFEQLTTLGLPAGASVPQTQAGISTFDPCILTLGGSKLVAFGRTKGLNFLFQVSSNDLGKTWGPVTMMSLPSLNFPCDGASLSNGQKLLVYNHYVPTTPTPNHPLTVATSTDALNWSAVAILETPAGQPGQDYSAPAVIQRANKQIEIVYAWKKMNIKRVVLDTALFTPAPIVGGVLPVIP